MIRTCMYNVCRLIADCGPFFLLSYLRTNVGEFTAHGKIKAQFNHKPKIIIVHYLLAISNTRRKQFTHEAHKSDYDLVCLFIESAATRKAIAKNFECDAVRHP